MMFRVQIWCAAWKCLMWSISRHFQGVLVNFLISVNRHDAVCKNVKHKECTVYIYIVWIWYYNIWFYKWLYMYKYIVIYIYIYINYVSIQISTIQLPFPRAITLYLGMAIPLTVRFAQYDHYKYMRVIGFP